MSFTAQSWAYQQQCGNGIEKAVLVFLAFSASRRCGDCFPSIKTIVRNVQHTERAVRAALKALAARKLIECERRFMPSGRCTSTLYKLPVVALPTPAPTQETPTTPTPAPTRGEPLSTVNSNQEEGRKWAPATPPTPAASSPPVSILPSQKEASRIVAEPVEAAEPEPEIVQLAIEAGHDPAEVPEELRDCVRGGRVTADQWEPTAADRACAVEFGHDWDILSRRFVNHYAAQGRRFTLAQWSAKFRNWCLPDPRYPRPATSGAKPDRMMQTLSAFAAVRQRRQEARL